MTNKQRHRDSGLASTVTFESNGGKSLNITPLDYVAHVEAQEMMTSAERTLALANFGRAECKDVIEAGKRKNICVVVSRNLDANTQRFLKLLLPCINELPDEIIWKARSPLVIDVGRIVDKHTRGQADIRDSQACVRVGVTQALNDIELARLADALTDDPVVMRSAMNSTFVHEIFHKLATQHDRGGNLILSRDEWVEIMRVNGVNAVTVLTPWQYDLLMSGEEPTMEFHSTPIDQLPTDPDAFMSALKRIYRHHFFYASNVHELVAFSATNVDLSKGADNLHNPLHDLEATRSIMRRGLFRTKNEKGEFENQGYEFDGTRWNSYKLGRAADGRFKTISIESVMPKMLAYETRLRERFNQKDLLHEHDFVKNVIREAEELARKELPFAWSRLSAADQNRIQTIAHKEAIDIRELTISWIVQETLFDVITEVFGLQKCDRVGVYEPSGFIAMTGRSSLVISTAPDIKTSLRTMSYHPLSTLSHQNTARKTRSSLDRDARIGERLHFADLKTSLVRRLVRFSSENMDAASEATALFERFTQVLKNQALGE